MLPDAMAASQQLLLWATAPHSQHLLHDVQSPLPRIVAVNACADSFAAWVGAVCGVGVGLFTLVSACLLNTRFESPVAAERSAAPPCCLLRFGCMYIVRKCWWSQKFVAESCAQVLVMPFLKKRIDAAFERIDKQVHILHTSTIGPHAASFLHVRQERMHVHVSSEAWSLMYASLQLCRLAADQGDNPVALQEALIEIEKDQVNISTMHDGSVLHNIAVCAGMHLTEKPLMWHSMSTTTASDSAHSTATAIAAAGWS